MRKASSAFFHQILSDRIQNWQCIFAVERLSVSRIFDNLILKLANYSTILFQSVKGEEEGKVMSFYDETKWCRVKAGLPFTFFLFASSQSSKKLLEILLGWPPWEWKPVEVWSHVLGTTGAAVASTDHPFFFSASKDAKLNDKFLGKSDTCSAIMRRDRKDTILLDIVCQKAWVFVCCN